MNLFFAGNFPQMKKPELEREMEKRVHLLGFDYKRLISFYYAKDSQTVLDLKENKNEAEAPRLVKRP